MIPAITNEARPASLALCAGRQRARRRGMGLVGCGEVNGRAVPPVLC
jgi:hypothetical protein